MDEQARTKDQRPKTKHQTPTKTSNTNKRLLHAASTAEVPRLVIGKPWRAPRPVTASPRASFFSIEYSSVRQLYIDQTASTRACRRRNVDTRTCAEESGLCRDYVATGASARGRGDVVRSIALLLFLWYCSRDTALVLSCVTRHRVSGAGTVWCGLCCAVPCVVLLTRHVDVMFRWLQIDLCV